MCFLSFRAVDFGFSTTNRPIRIAGAKQALRARQQPLLALFVFMILEKKSPCKVNLLLNILGKRPDGFHELESVMHQVNLCDELRFTRSASGIQLTCSDPTLPTDSSNLVHRAAAAFVGAAGIKDGIGIHLEKRIPIEAGLGGGSSNAAVTLLALNERFDGVLSAPQIHDIAASLGSDVPFFLQSGPALASGRGEQIKPLDPFPSLRGAAFLLIYPGFGVATAWAYRELARFPGELHGSAGRAQKLITSLCVSNVRAAGSQFYNSLESPVFEKYPLLAIYQEFLRTEGAAGTLMSGSGSTTFAIADSEDSARELEARFLSRFGRCWTAVALVPVE